MLRDNKPRSVGQECEAGRIPRNIEDLRERALQIRAVHAAAIEIVEPKLAFVPTRAITEQEAAVSEHSRGTPARHRSHRPAVRRCQAPETCTVSGFGQNRVREGPEDGRWR